LHARCTRLVQVEIVASVSTLFPFLMKGSLKEASLRLVEVSH